MATNKKYIVTCILHKVYASFHVTAGSVEEAVRLGREAFKNQFKKLPEEIQAERE